VSQDRVAQRGVGQPCDHRNLDGGKDLPSTDSPKPHGKPARKPSASKSGPRGRDLHNPLTDITRRLEVMSAVAVTAEVALRAQNCEQGADIAL
jgi:hypothetical protein